MEKIKRIAIVGPESTGKSMLAAALAKHFQCGFVKEVARDYLEHLGRPYQQSDLDDIARLQVAEEEKVLATNPPVLICDTTLLVIRIWSEYKYGNCSDTILSLEKSRHYDHYLLTDIDLPWEDDPLREHPHERQQLFSIYYRALMRQSVPFSVVFGEGIERVERSLKFKV